MPGPDWLYFATAALLALVGLPLLCWSLFHDRSRGRRRCPKCWYDMTGVPGRTCPECGRIAKSERRLAKTRRHWRAATAAILVILLALTASQAPQVRRDGFLSIVPTWALLGLESLAGHWFPHLAEARAARLSTHFASLWGWERDELLWRILRDRLPCRWLTGRNLRTTLPADDNSGIIELPIDDPHRRLFVMVMPPQSADLAKSSSISRWLSFEEEWWDGTDLIQGTEHHKSVEVKVWVERPQMVVEWETVLRFPIHREDSVDQLLKPVGADQNSLITQAIRRDLQPRLIYQPVSGRPSIVLRRVTDPACDGVTIGLAVEICHHGEPVATARAWMHGGQVGSVGPLDPIFIDAELKSFDLASRDDPAWTVRIRGDGEMALRDFSATKYWAGEFTLPLKDVLK